jgi:hypothetical protein
MGLTEFNVYSPPPRRVEQGVGLLQRLAVVVVPQRLVVHQPGGVGLVPPVHGDVVHVGVDQQVSLGEVFAHQDFLASLRGADIHAVLQIHGVVIGHLTERMVLVVQLGAAHVAELVPPDEAM